MKWAILLLFCLPAYAQTWFSNITKDPTTNSCRIHWTTAVPTIGHIEYGTDPHSYTQHSSNSRIFTLRHVRTISGLREGTKYHFRLMAANRTKRWMTSSAATCTTTKHITQKSVKLSWLASRSSGISHYEVYRTTISGGYYMLLARTARLSYLDTTVDPGHTYYYAIRAKNSGGRLSKYSDEVKVTVP